MLCNIFAVLFLIKLFKKSVYHARKFATVYLVFFFISVSKIQDGYIKLTELDGFSRHSIHITQIDKITRSTYHYFSLSQAIVIYILQSTVQEHV